MAEGGSLDEMIKTEVGDNTFMGDRNEQLFALLLRVTWWNGKSLPIDGFTG